MLTLLSAAAHAQSAWVKLCETQTATVRKKICLMHHEGLDHTGKVLVSAAFRRRGSGKTSVHGDCPTWRAAGAGLVTGPLTLVPQLLFPRRRHLRSRRCTGSLPKYPGQLRKALGEWVRFGPGLARWLSQGWDGARRHRVIPPLRATH